MLALGALSSVGGVLALVEHDLKRFLAFSSIENVGIIVLALGAAATSTNTACDLAAIAFAAALLHDAESRGLQVAALPRSRCVRTPTRGSLDLDHIGGLLKRMPLTGGAFLIRSLAIAGLPPLNGWVSEWLTLSLLLQLGSGARAPRIPGATRRRRSQQPQRSQPSAS